jgi:PKD repeat protein
MLTLVLSTAARLEAETIAVAAGGDLQAALDAAQPGDTILLQAGAEFVGNFLLPVKGGSTPITLRSSTPDSLLPPPGVRVQPAHAPLLARIRSGNPLSALRTAPGAHHWHLRYLEFAPNTDGYGDIIQIGDGSKAQDTLARVPHTFVLSHLYVHGDPKSGQKRGIALNASQVTIRDSYIAECKAVGMDTQAIGGWNGPGPYTIENNYLEGAGENIMIGGADPSIPGLIADGITFRYNYLSRPMSWRDPIVGAPASLGAATENGGTLAPGVYAYRVTARRKAGQAIWARSTASVEVSVTVSAPGTAVRLTWAPVPDATEYRVYGRTPGAQATVWTTTAPRFVDTGAAGAAEAVPTSEGTRWSVKNLFELKNARNVLVAGNILENHWKESQPGYAVVLTPRNSGGTCSWCAVEDVVFEHNIVRNVAAGINLLGYDTDPPSAQAQRIAIRHNLFYDVTTHLGGNGWFMLIGAAPRDVIVAHNTVEANGSTAIYAYGGTAADPACIYGFEMSANAMRHGTYGMGGASFAYGLGILDAYYPGHVFTANYLAGAPASRYPAGTLVAGPFEAQFLDAASNDFALAPASALRNGAPDGTDIGADVARVLSSTAGVMAGLAPDAAPETPRGPTAGFTASCTYLACSFSDTSVPGSADIASRTWSFGDGTVVLATSPAHAYALAGSYEVTLEVTDGSGRSASVLKFVRVEAPNAAPAASFTSSCAGLDCTFADASLDADGTVSAWQWTFSDGSTATTRSVSRTFPAPGAYAASLIVTDDDGASAAASGQFTVGARVHVGALAGTPTTWTKYGNTYWSAAVVVAIHDADEAPVAGALVRFAWSGAVTKTGSCVTDAAGQCTAASGTLSAKRPSVALSVTDVAAPAAIFDEPANHGAETASVPATATIVPGGAGGSTELPAAVHVGNLDGASTTWSRYGNQYWSAAVSIAVHDNAERPVAGAMVQYAWSGAVVKTGTCVTDANGRCDVPSGTLSWFRPHVALTVTDVAAPPGVFDPLRNHGADATAAGAAVTVVRP